MYEMMRMWVTSAYTLDLQAVLPKEHRTICLCVCIEKQPGAAMCGAKL
jgi:hypothetical protein